MELKNNLDKSLESLLALQTKVDSLVKSKQQSICESNSEWKVILENANVSLKAKINEHYTTNLVNDKINMSKNSMAILDKRYLQVKENGEKETPVELFVRVAEKLALIDLKHLVENNSFACSSEKDGSQEFVKSLIDKVFSTFNDFYRVMREGLFIPAGRTLANKTTSVPNCVVLHPKDSMESIFDVLKEAALLQKAGCGLGFPLHLLRPAGEETVTSGGQSSGPISFLFVYNMAFGVIKQQSRHGANMAVMSVNHPDILEFIYAKSQEGVIKNFNLSVGLSDEFMSQVVSKCEKPWKCTFNGKEYNPRRIERDPNQYTVFKIKEETNLTASDIFMEIVDRGWLNGEPGCVFLDKANEDNPLPSLGRIESCNPCKFNYPSLISLLTVY